MKAIVNSPVCPLMSQPRRDCEMADEALFGMVVDVLERTTPGYCRVRTHYRYEGYACVDDLILSDERAGWWAGLPKKVVFHKNTCDVMADPKVQSWQLVTLPRGAVVSPVGEAEGGWQRTALPDGREGYLRASWLGEYFDAPPALPEEELRRRIVETAMLYAGTHYRWGGKSPLGIDCSGLTSMAYLLNGILIYRDARIVEGFPVREISREEMKPGDLLFFPGHIALYMGGGRYCHSTGRAGDDGFTVNSLDPSAPDYRADLAEQITQVGSYFR